MKFVLVLVLLFFIIIDVYATDYTIWEIDKTQYSKDMVEKIKLKRSNKINKARLIYIPENCLKIHNIIVNKDKVKMKFSDQYLKDVHDVLMEIPCHRPRTTTQCEDEYIFESFRKSTLTMSEKQCRLLR